MYINNIRLSGNHGGFRNKQTKNKCKNKIDEQYNKRNGKTIRPFDIGRFVRNQRGGIQYAELHYERK